MRTHQDLIDMVKRVDTELFGREMRSFLEATNTEETRAVMEAFLQYYVTPRSRNVQS